MAVVYTRPSPAQTRPPPCLVHPRELKMTKHPSVWGVSLDSLRTDYKAIFFKAALTHFVAQYQNPVYTKAQVEMASFEHSHPILEALCIPPH
jgi:hypothetical protein